MQADSWPFTRVRGCSNTDSDRKNEFFSWRAGVSIAGGNRKNIFFSCDIIFFVKIRIYREISYDAKCWWNLPHDICVYIFACSGRRSFSHGCPRIRRNPKGDLVMDRAGTLPIPVDLSLAIIAYHAVLSYRGT